MIKKLHIQLTLFCSIVIGLVLIVVSTISLKSSESHIRSSDVNATHSNIATINDYLVEQPMISYRWIASMEANYSLYININNNGKPFLANKLRSTPLRQRVFDEAIKIAADVHQFSLVPPNNSEIEAQNISFDFVSHDNKKYFASLAILPKKDGYLSSVILHPDDALQAQINKQRTSFAIAIGGSLIFLLFFFYFLSSYLLRPLIKNQEKQTAFIASASHELRSPLMVISSSLSAMKVAPAHKSLEFSHVIEDELSRMSALLDDLLLLTQDDSHARIACLVPVELDTLLLQTYEKFTPIAEECHRQLVLDLPYDELPLCQCDAKRIEQLLHILINNALSYTHENDQITLSISANSSDFCIKVIDTGIGIADIEKARIFDRFYRVDHSRKDKKHFGLGLCIALEIVNLHHGKIQVIDTAGGGATFSVYLPR